MDSNHSLTDEIYSPAVVSERLLPPNLIILQESNLLLPSSTTGVVSIPLRIKLQQAFIGKLITHNRPYMDLKILAGILLATQDFVPRSRIELLPFPCKRNTLPLRQRGKLFCLPRMPIKFFKLHLL